jgi:shikimate kinase
MKKEKLIYLVGFMASGKSTVGRILANKIGFPFIDIDDVIESRERLPIWRIFEMKGEPYFRELETRELITLTEQALKEGLVIATGGGLPCNPGTLSYMKSHGRVVYLKAGVDEIIERTGEGETRPVFQRLGRHGDIRENVERLLRERELYYLQADITVPNSSGRDPDDVSEDIIKALKSIPPRYREK